jgi:hypothetical protein
MAYRSLTPVYFGEIEYNSDNEDKRWFLDAKQAGESSFTMVSDKADHISKLFASYDGTTGPVTALAPALTSPNSATNAPIVIAVRLPQTTRLLNAVLQGIAINDRYTIYISGRSDKKYSEIIDWVKVSEVLENGDHLAESDITGFVPDVTKISTASMSSVVTTAPISGPVKGDILESGGNILLHTDGVSTVSLGAQPNSGTVFHSRFFPYMAAWVKIEINNVGTLDVDLDRLFLHSFLEDIQGGAGTEDPPVAEMVYPLDEKDWLPSQTIYATALVTEPDADACHFGFEIYKESGLSATWDGASDFGVTGGDHLLYKIESNELNLDGTVNENYRHSWHPLGVATADAKNVVNLPGNPGPVHALLIVPIEGANGGANGSFYTVKFYKNAGNVLLLDCKLDSAKMVGGVQNFDSITLPVTKEDRKTAEGWVIETTSLSILDGFDRIEFINNSGGADVVTKVEIYYISADITAAVSGTDNVEVDVDGETVIWKGGASHTSFQAPDYVAQIGFCFPTTTTNTVGYTQGSEAQLIAEANNEYNPANVGKGFGETNDGDWPLVPKHGGLLLGPSTDDLINGDSPVITAENFSASAKSTLVADKSVYVRVALPDPYTDGERYYARAYVWDGRTQVV